MKWEGHRRSENVEDRRGDGGAGGGGLPRMGPRIGGRGLGIGSIAIALVAGWVFGINPLTVLGLLGGIDAGPATSRRPAWSRTRWATMCRACSA